MATKRERAQKSWEKTFARYTWAKDDKIPEGAERQQLTGQLDKLVKARAHWKPSDPRYVEATRLQAIMQKKSKEAAEREGRYTKKAVAVDEAEAQLDLCDEGQEVIQAKLTKLGNSMLKNVEELDRLRNVIQYQHQDTASAGRAAVEVANATLAGEPDEPMDESTEIPLELEPPAKRPRTDPGAGCAGASGSSGGDERAALMAQKVHKLKALCQERGLKQGGKKSELVQRLLDAQAEEAPPTAGVGEDKEEAPPRTGDEEEENPPTVHMGEEEEEEAPPTTGNGEEGEAAPPTALDGDSDTFGWECPSPLSSKGLEVSASVESDSTEKLAPAVVTPAGAEVVAAAAGGDTLGAVAEDPAAVEKEGIAADHMVAKWCLDNIHIDFHIHPVMAKKIMNMLIDSLRYLTPLPRDHAGESSAERVNQDVGRSLCTTLRVHYSEGHFNIMDDSYTAASASIKRVE